MCHFYASVYTICGHSTDSVPDLECRVSKVFPCLFRETTAELVLGWCQACSRTLGRRTRRARRPKYPSRTASLTVENYWAFKSRQGWARPVDMRTVRGRDIDAPRVLPYNTKEAKISSSSSGGGGVSGLNYEERTLLWALAQVKPDLVVLRTRFVDTSAPWGWAAIAGIVREATFLTLAEWSSYPGKESLLRAIENGAQLFGTMRQEYFLTDALADGVPVWDGSVKREMDTQTETETETATEESGASPKFASVASVASVADDPAILHLGRAFPTHTPAAQAGEKHLECLW